MRRITAFLLALALVAALAGCNRQTPPDGDEPPVPDVGPNEPDDGGHGDVPKPDDGDDKTPDEGDDPDKPDEPDGPDKPENDAVKLYVGSLPAGFAAAGLYGNEAYTLVREVEDVAAALRDGQLDAAIMPVTGAAKAYGETGESVRIAALIATDALGLYEVGTDVDSIYALAEKSVSVAQDCSGAAEIFEHIALEYGFIMGETLNITRTSPEALVADMSSGSVKLGVMTSADAARIPNARLAIDLAEEWEYVTLLGTGLPEGCLVVRSDMPDETLTALLADLDGSRKAVAADPAIAARAGLAGSESEAEFAVSGCDYIWVVGAAAIREKLSAYYETMYRLDPSLLGGSIPDDGFYR